MLGDVRAGDSCLFPHLSYLCTLSVFASCTYWCPDVCAPVPACSLSCMCVCSGALGTLSCVLNLNFLCWWIVVLLTQCLNLESRKLQTLLVHMCTQYMHVTMEINISHTDRNHLLHFTLLLKCYTMVLFPRTRLWIWWKTRQEERDRDLQRKETERTGKIKRQGRRVKEAAVVGWRRKMGRRTEGRRQGGEDKKGGCRLFFHSLGWKMPMNYR